MRGHFVTLELEYFIDKFLLVFIYSAEKKPLCLMEI